MADRSKIRECMWLFVKEELQSRGEDTAGIFLSADKCNEKRLSSRRNTITSFTTLKSHTHSLPSRCRRVDDTIPPRTMLCNTVAAAGLHQAREKCDAMRNCVKWYINIVIYENCCRSFVSKIGLRMTVGVDCVASYTTRVTGHKLDIFAIA